MCTLLKRIMNYDDSFDVKIDGCKKGVAIEIIKYDNETGNYDVVYYDFDTYDNIKIFESKIIKFFQIRKKLDKLRDNIKSLYLSLNVEHENGGMKIDIIDNMHNVVIFNDFQLFGQYDILIDNANEFIKNKKIEINNEHKLIFKLIDNELKMNK